MSARAPRRLGRHILLDLTPLRRSRDYRALITGLGVSVLGNQLTTVAVPFQVYAMTRSSLIVGLVSLAQLFPLIFGSLLGGSLVDAMDRRKLLIVVEALAALCSAALALNADLLHAAVAAVRVPGRDRRAAGIDSSARNAMLPGLVGLGLLPASERALPVAVPDRGDRRACPGRAAARRGRGARRLLGQRRHAAWSVLGRARHVAAAAGDGRGRRARRPGCGRRSRGCGSCGDPSRSRART